MPSRQCLVGTRATLVCMHLYKSWLRIKNVLPLYLLELPIQPGQLIQLNQALVGLISRSGWFGNSKGHKDRHSCFLPHIYFNESRQKYQIHFLQEAFEVDITQCDAAISSHADCIQVRTFALIG